ncbi:MULTISPECIES: hypothetical protein [unclassified Clostridium]|uniref:hypothetical protein n=1 Tax=unclassified Clostridium TaxID=2614128 RepID=UPI0003619C9E|nr:MULTISPECIES: hypothetical protein [unclassified Clostridium]MBY7001616.1 hypothetical protein [Clostridium botulinum]
MKIIKCNLVLCEVFAIITLFQIYYNCVRIGLSKNKKYTCYTSYFNVEDYKNLSIYK